jgi:hypothetical protein
MHNIFAQVEGRKRFLLFNPDQFDLLYPGPLNTRSQHLSRIDVKAPDLKRFPKAARAEYWEAVVEPGDLLFMPAFWWHQVSAPSLAVSVNYWWRADVRDCVSPAFFRQLYMNSVLEDVRGVFKGYDLDGLGGGAVAALRLAELAVEHRQAGAAARVCGGVVVAALQDACEELALPGEQYGADGLLAELERRSVWSLDDCAAAHSAMALAGNARPGHEVPAEDVRQVVARLRGSRLMWGAAASP